jgi:hypothetical protein
MLPVDESILQTKQVVVVVLVVFAVKLHGRRLEYFEQTNVWNLPNPRPRLPSYSD